MLPAIGWSAVNVRTFAHSIVTTPDLEAKLEPAPPELPDDSPGGPLAPAAPARPPELTIVPGSRAKVPGVEGWRDPHQRRRILHALANHELQAVELFAWALLAFPEAPPELRRGWLRVLGDEQRHTRMYRARLEASGARFGDFAVSGYFWNKVDHYTTPLAFLCAMALTFEHANLDHTVESSQAAREAGDPKTARVIEQVHRDEIEHVRLGWIWLGRLKDPGQSMWDAFQAHLAWPLRPAKARGSAFQHPARLAAGMDEEFVRRMEACELDDGSDGRVGGPG